MKKYIAIVITGSGEFRNMLPADYFEQKEFNNKMIKVVNLTAFFVGL
jgi:hypothetical protein